MLCNGLPCMKDFDPTHFLYKIRRGIPHEDHLLYLTPLASKEGFQEFYLKAKARIWP